MESWQRLERDGDHLGAQNRLLELAMYKEKKKSGKQNDLHESFTGKDGKNYGIVKQNQYFYIMEADQGASHSDEYNYIGGIRNKNKYRFNNHVGAYKFMLELQHKRGVMTEQTTPEEEKPVAPAPQPEAEPAPQDDMGVEPTAEPEAQAEPTPAEDEGMEPMKEINSLMGKLGYELRNAEVAPNTAVSLMKQLIAALPMGELSQEEKDELSLSIKHGKSDVKGYETAGKPEGEDELGMDAEKETMDAPPADDFGDDMEDLEEMLEMMENNITEMETEMELEEAFVQSTELLDNKKTSPTSNYFK